MSSETVSTVSTNRRTIDDKPLVFRLKVIQGPEAGKHLDIDRTQAPLLIGTGESAALRLTDREVSRRHLQVEAMAQTLSVKDLGSTNGTTVNGLRVVEAILRGGETLQLGQAVLLVEVSEASPSRELTRITNLGRVIGGSVAMRRLYEPLERLAQSEVPVIIEGETGTGKELVAETLHELGPRSQGPFVVLDCAASEVRTGELLFGIEDASGVQPGLLEQANGGTLLIDEIADLDPAAQTKLVRTLEKGEFVRVGSTKWHRADVRIIATTRRDLDREVQEGRFRPDLFFRLSVGRIALPPLHQRHGDITLLANYFWGKFGGADSSIPATLVDTWNAYEWPGNVRELTNAVSRRLTLGDSVDASDVEAIRESRAEDPGVLMARVLDADLGLSQARELIVEDFERRYVERILARHGGNVTRAAAASGIARRYFQVLRARHRP